MSPPHPPDPPQGQSGAYAIARANQLLDGARSMCEQRTRERDDAIAREAAMARELGRALAENEALRADIDGASDLLCEAMELAEESGAEGAYQAIDRWTKARPEVDRASPQDPVVLLRALTRALELARHRDLDAVGEKLGVPRRDEEPDAEYRLRLLARLGVEA